MKKTEVYRNEDIFQAHSDGARTQSASFDFKSSNLSILWHHLVFLSSRCFSDGLENLGRCNCKWNLHLKILAMVLLSARHWVCSGCTEMIKMCFPPSWHSPAQQHHCPESSCSSVFIICVSHPLPSCWALSHRPPTQNPTHRVLIITHGVLTSYQGLYLHDRIWFSWLPWWLRLSGICPQCKGPGFDLWVRKIPWRREWQSTPLFLPRESHGQRSQAGYSSWGHKE